MINKITNDMEIFTPRDVIFGTGDSRFKSNTIKEITVDNEGWVRYWFVEKHNFACNKYIDFKKTLEKMGKTAIFKDGNGEYVIVGKGDGIQKPCECVYSIHSSETSPAPLMDELEKGYNGTVVNVVTQEQWDKVSVILRYEWGLHNWGTYSTETCIGIKRDRYSPKSYWEEANYKIITFEEFMKDHQITELEELKEDNILLDQVADKLKIENEKLKEDNIVLNERIVELEEESEKLFIKKQEVWKICDKFAEENKILRKALKLVL